MQTMTAPASSQPADSIERTLPRLDQRNDKGTCWTCLRRNRTCDTTLPRCNACSERGLKCAGYEVRLSWPAGVLQQKRRRTVRRLLTSQIAASSSHSSSSSSLPSVFSNESSTSVHSNDRSDPMFCSLSPLALPSDESFLMQHFLQNISRIALAVDYHGNGYRSLLPLALAEPALLNAALAVAASHHSRWQHKPDTSSKRYLRASCKALRERFTNQALISQPVTLVCMLLLVTYEVFGGSCRWTGHYDAIKGWVRSRGDCSDLDAFLKNWVCLVDTQSALNLGTRTMPELDAWMDVATGHGDTVDALFGCSAKLPKLMSVASRLYVAARDGTISHDELQQQVQALQEEIRSTAFLPDALPDIGLSCRSTTQAFSTSLGMDEDELRQRALATAEIFRYASHIYVHRIVSGPGDPLSPELRQGLETALCLLTVVPDALGPGANLGWCLVVLGAELDVLDQRNYIRSRWEGLHLLGIYNTKNGQNILEEVWNHRDLVRQGCAIPERWQDTMQRIGEAQILL